MRFLMDEVPLKCGPFGPDPGLHGRAETGQQERETERECVCVKGGDRERHREAVRAREET